MWIEVYYWGVRGGLIMKMNREFKFVEGGFMFFLFF